MEYADESERTRRAALFAGRLEVIRAHNRDPKVCRTKQSRWRASDAERAYWATRSGCAGGHRHAEGPRPLLPALKLYLAV